MATKWIVARQTNVQSSDRKTIPKWLFDSKADADAWAKRLGHGAAMAKALHGLEDPWRGSDHDLWETGALTTLQHLDPDAVAGVRYEVYPVEEFVAPNEPAPATPYEAWFRQGRDAG